LLAEISRSRTAPTDCYLDKVFFILWERSLTTIIR